MVRDADWKYIFMANGGREQLFNLTEDPDELRQRLDDRPDVAERLRTFAIAALRGPSGAAALNAGKLRAFPFAARQSSKRVYQFSRDRGVTGFPPTPADALRDYRRGPL